MTSEDKNNKNFTLLTATTVLFWIVILLIVLAVIYEIKLFPFLKYFSSKFYYKPHINIIDNGRILGVNVYKFIYLIYFLSILTVKFVSDIFDHFGKNVALKKILVNVGLWLFIFTFGLQTLGHIKYFKREIKMFSGKSSEKRHLIVSGDSYWYAMFCKKHLEENIKAELITDLDLSTDPWMLMHRKLAYYLYPIDIRNVRDGEKTALIYFFKKNAQSNIPEGYKALVVLDSFNLIATKEKTQ